MNDEDQNRFVQATEHDAIMLDTSGTVAWEFALTWWHALNS